MFVYFVIIIGLKSSLQSRSLLYIAIREVTKVTAFSFRSTFIISQCRKPNTYFLLTFIRFCVPSADDATAFRLRVRHLKSMRHSVHRQLLCHGKTEHRLPLLSRNCHPDHRTDTLDEQVIIFTYTQSPRNVWFRPISPLLQHYSLFSP